MNTDQIEFRDIPGFLGYRVGSDGTVWSRWMPRAVLGAMWRQMATNAGKHYPQVILRKKGERINCYVHRLMLIAFVGEPQDGQEACHNNGVKTDCRIENLRWDSRTSNMRDRASHGNTIRGERFGNAKLTDAAVAQMRAIYRYETTNLRAIAEQFNVSCSTAQKAIARQTWSHVP